MTNITDMSFLKLHSWAHNLCNTALSPQWHHTFRQTYQKLISSSQHSVCEYTTYRGTFTVSCQQESMTSISVGMIANTMGLLFLHWVADQAHTCESSVIHSFPALWSVLQVKSTHLQYPCKVYTMKTKCCQDFYKKKVLLQQCRVK